MSTMQARWWNERDTVEGVSARRRRTSLRLMYRIHRSIRVLKYSCFRKRMSTLGGDAHDALAEIGDTGKFVRTAAGFREIISNEHPIFKPENGRYHLYISLACPWAYRCLAVIKLKGLGDCISHTVVHPTWQRTRPSEESDKHCGWAFYQSGVDAPLANPTGHGSFAVDGKCSL
jgi:hypothetical protein